MMINMDIDYFKQRLLARRDELQASAETGTPGTATVALDQTRVGRLSRMDALQAQAMSQAAQQRRSVELQRVMAALRRIEAGHYGYCLDCDGPIAEARLAVDPAAPLCIICADKS